jgi:hypothetical protein
MWLKSLSETFGGNKLIRNCAFLIMGQDFGLKKWQAGGKGRGRKSEWERSEGCIDRKISKASHKTSPPHPPLHIALKWGCVRKVGLGSRSNLALSQVTDLLGKDLHLDTSGDVLLIWCIYGGGAAELSASFLSPSHLRTCLPAYSYISHIYPAWDSLYGDNSPDETVTIMAKSLLR